jgi:hypothetical protein
VTPERWRRINEIFHAALDQDDGARDRFIHEACAGDEELLREVQSLLATHARAHDYLEAPAWQVAADLMRDDDAALAPGQTIGKYRIVQQVARGGMGVVYRATDDVLNRPVALKSLPAEYASDRARRERLVREARLAAQLNHRAIATVYELIESGDALYIASEFVEGITLRRELQDGPLPPAHLLGTLTEIAAALCAAHAHSIVHRDLKPENIIRRTDGQIKVLDFGLARIAAGSDSPTATVLTEAGIVAGTPGYMAPEVLAGQSADARSDIFVFGLVAWELATGRHPFGTSPHSQMARLHDISAGQDVQISGELPLAGLDAIIRRCLRRRTEDRYQTSEALLDDLRSLHGSRGVVVSAPAAQPGLWWWRFHQGMMAAVVASAPIWAWIVRRSVGAAGAWTFFIVLALATGAVMLRLNLLFTSRVHPAILPDHHARLSRWIPWVESGVSAALLWIAANIGREREATAALLVSLAIVIAASLAVIEPTTARGAGITDAGPPARKG